MPVCFAVESPIFQPALRIVTAVTNARQAAVTTSFDHDYNDGLIVGFRVPNTFGMRQLNNLTGIVTVTGSDTFTVDIDTVEFDVFSEPVGNEQCAQVLPVAEVNSTLSSAVKNVLSPTN